MRRVMRKKRTPANAVSRRNRLRRRNWQEEAEMEK